MGRRHGGRAGVCVDGEAMVMRGSGLQRDTENGDKYLDSVKGKNEKATIRKISIGRVPRGLKGYEIQRMSDDQKASLRKIIGRSQRRTMKYGSKMKVRKWPSRIWQES